MERILISETPKFIGQKVKICGWIDTVRSHGKIIFFDLRDRSGTAQLVFVPKNNEETNDLAKKISSERAVEIEGEVKQRPEKMVNEKLATGQVEISIESLKTLAESEVLPFDIKDLNASLPTILDYRPLTLRNEKIKAVFKLQEEVINSFRKTLSEMGFTEFQSPSIVPLAPEGGAELFRLDYFEYSAYLAQSPQVYKQILVGVFERVFTVTQAYRAEPSMTTRHLCEFTSLDAEMGFIDSWEDLMDVIEAVTKNIFADLQKNRAEELKIFNPSMPDLGVSFPRIKMREAQKIILERTGRDNTKEPDLQPEDEKEICRYAKEKHGSDLIFVTHYPTKKRPFYTFADPKDPEYTLSFDLLYNGVELISGGQRINDYNKLVDNIKKWGNDPKNFEYYLQAFKYGMPPEGGFAFGAERIIKQLLGLENVREAAIFPRDMERIDQRLSVLQEDKKKSKKE
ncbi:MAG: aspartate--tRNA(Asn) ligase [Candidatus Pacebacteria bacterium]|nr:aspartate--tRNA(Asn) ligase [Candidatus Paceibacterota bacterium]